MCSADSIGLIWVCVLGSVGCMSDLYGVSVGVSCWGSMVCVGLLSRTSMGRLRGVCGFVYGTSMILLGYGLWVCYGVVSFFIICYRT